MTHDATPAAPGAASREAEPGALPLWTGLLAGPLVFAADLGLSYALVEWSCSTHRTWVLHAITLASILLTAGGMLVAWRCLQQLPREANAEGGRAIDRSRFMALAGLILGGFFIIVILANGLPRLLLSPCAG